MAAEKGGRGPEVTETSLQVRVEDIPEAIPGGIPEGGLALEFVSGPELIEAYVPVGEDGYRLLAPVRSNFRLTRRGQEVLVRGRVETRLALACDRCLATIELSVDDEVAVTFLPHPVADEEAQFELSEDDLEVEFYGPEAVIDLGEVIVEELALAVPFRVLCSESCRGLCPRCGADLNREQCRCEAGDVDPRLAVLKDFKLE